VIVASTKYLPDFLNAFAISVSVPWKLVIFTLSPAIPDTAKRKDDRIPMKKNTRGFIAGPPLFLNVRSIGFGENRRFGNKGYFQMLTFLYTSLPFRSLQEKLYDRIFIHRQLVRLLKITTPHFPLEGFALWEGIGSHDIPQRGSHFLTHSHRIVNNKVRAMVILL
jgi:hypothetical protein